MNIFILNEHPQTAAKMQHNKHVVKMVLESTQMLCSAFDPIHKPPYKKAYYNHPCTIWTRTSKENYMWLLIHAFSLAIEYTHRYNKVHASQKVINWCYKNIDKIDFPEQKRTPFALAMPDQYKTSDAVESYIYYYISEKLQNAQWKNREKPFIFNEDTLALISN